MNGAKTLDEKSLLSLYEDLNRLTDTLNGLKEKIRTLLPAKYGSDLWWEKENKSALKEIADGKSFSINSKEELKKFLQI